MYYGKVIGGRPGFIALDLLPAFLRLRVEPGGYLKMYRRGDLSLCAKLVMDALTKRGAAETKALKLSSGFDRPRLRTEFDRAMKELQEKFLALKVEEHYEPFTYVWDTMGHRWGEALKAAKALTRREAAYTIVRRYFEVAGYASEPAAARLLRNRSRDVQIGHKSPRPRGQDHTRRASRGDGRHLRRASRFCRLETP